MEICSSSVSLPPSPPSGFPYSDEADSDWVRACLIKAFPIDPAADRAARIAPARVRAAKTKQAAAETGPKPTTHQAESIADPTERRGEDRSKVAVYRSAMLHWDGVEALCLVRNVSSGGMMGKLLIELPVGTPVLVEMRSGHEIAGHVVWARDHQIGVQFDTSIDVQQVMNGAHRVTHSWRQRMPRVHVPCPVTLLTQNGRQTVQLLDLSQGGAKIEGDLLHEGDDVTLAVKGLDPRRGTVRWAQDGCAGIAFLAAIPFDALALWALERQREMGRLAGPPVESA